MEFTFQRPHVKQYQSPAWLTNAPVVCAWQSPAVTEPSHCDGPRGFCGVRRLPAAGRLPPLPEPAAPHSPPRRNAEGVVPAVIRRFSVCGFPQFLVSKVQLFINTPMHIQTYTQVRKKSNDWTFNLANLLFTPLPSSFMYKPKASSACLEILGSHFS